MAVPTWSASGVDVRPSTRPTRPLASLCPSPLGRRLPDGQCHLSEGDVEGISPNQTPLSKMVSSGTSFACVGGR